MKKVTDNKTPRRGQFSARVSSQRDYVENHKHLFLELTGEAAAIYAKARPGQFIQIACRDLANARCAAPLLRRPISLAGVTVQNDRTTIEIIYRVLGPGTQWLTSRQPGDTVDLLGPLGQPFKLPKDKNHKCLLLGGGIGLPPMFFLAQEMRREGYANRLAFAAARCQTQMQGSFLMDKTDPDNPLRPMMCQVNFNQSETPAILATDNGTCGFHGTIVDALYEFLKVNPDWKDATLFACGPDAMLRAVGQFAIERSMPGQVCLEAYMSCGIGLCQSCAVATNELNDFNASIKEKKFRLVCANGPVFDAWHVDWESKT